eukprot:TRINITY_DN4303_c0_g1_i1.p1 TRINITY_DN4303_c0_g1~~TRINITY_DN4303_c0_g1_i1.p1  ORF type:complete len:991 (+),score=233.10 TRINITY_DN4303_c0_g1_i1:94-2973(+)
MPSLRGLTMALSLSCVVIGSLVAAYLAITSGDSALSATKGTADEALRQCFSTASESVLIQTTAVIEGQLQQSELFLNDFLSLPMELAQMYTDQLHSVHPDKSLNWNWMWEELAPQLWSTMQTFTGSITGIGVSTAAHQILWQYEEDATLYAPKDHFHQVKTLWNDGTDPARPTSYVGVPAWGTGRPPTDPAVLDMPCSGARIEELPASEKYIYDHFCFWPPDGNLSCGGSVVHKGAGTIQGVPCSCVPRCSGRGKGGPEADPNGCIIPAGFLHPSCTMLNYGPTSENAIKFWLMGYLAPIGTVKFSPPGSIDGYLGSITVGSWGHPASREPPYSSQTANFLGRAGIVWVGTDLRSVSAFLQQAPLPGLSRVFFVFLKDEYAHLTGSDTTGMIMGASHGAVSQGVVSQILDFIRPENSTDAVVRAAAEYIYSQADDASGRDGYTVLSNLTGSRPALFEAELPAALTPGRSGTSHKLFITVREYSDALSQVSVWMVMTFDRELILGAIDEGERSVKENIAAANDRVDSDLQDDRRVLYIIIGAVAVAMILASVVFVLAITRPLKELGDEMQEVARMKLDNVNETLSAVDEVARCQVAFLAMVKALREYKEYIPLSLLQDSEDDGDEETDVVSFHRIVSHGQHTSYSHGSAMRSQSSFRSGTSGGNTEGNSAGFSVEVRRSAGGRNLQDRTAKGIARKQASFVAAGVASWHDVLKDGEADIVAVHTAVLQCVVENTGKGKGVPDTFIGDRIMLSFNAVRQVMGHRLVAGAVARELAVTCSGPESPSKLLQLSFAGTSGDVRCGNLGCPGMMRFTCFGKAVSWCWAMQRYTQTVPLRADAPRAFCEQVISEELAAHHVMRWVALVLYPKRQHGCLPVFQIGERKVAGEEEWMYQLEGSLREDPYRTWNTLERFISRGQAEEAYRQLELQCDTGSTAFREDPLVKWWMTRLQSGSLVHDELQYL